MPIIKVIIEEAEEGGYIAHCPALKGCMSQGETLEEVKENIKDAAAGWLEAKLEQELQSLIKKNREAKTPKNGERIENLKIPLQPALAGA
jgi:predicted RNase H-like HicB family nuclease